MRFKKFLFFLILPALLLFVISPINAHAASGSFNYKDFSKYSISNEHYVHVKSEFPTNYSGLVFLTNDDRCFYLSGDSAAGSHSLRVLAGYPTIDMYFTPFGGYHKDTSGPGTNISSFGLFDTSYVDHDTYFTYSFNVTIPRGFSLQTLNKAQLIVYYTGSDGRIVQVESFTPVVNQSSSFKFSLSGEFTPSYLSRDDVTGFSICFFLDDIGVITSNNADGSADVLVSIDSFTLEFDISSYLYASIFGFNDVSDALNELISGGQAGQDAADKFGDQADKQSSALNQLIEQLSKGERPDLSVLSQYFSSLFGDFSVEGFNAALLRLWDNPFIFQLMVLSATLMLASYILYGKKV